MCRAFELVRGRGGWGEVRQCVLLSVCVRRVWAIPTLQVANWTQMRSCASSRMFIELPISVGTHVATLREGRPRSDVFKLGTSLQLKSRLLAHAFGVD